MSEKHWKCDHCKHDNDKHRKNCARCNSHHRCEHDKKEEEDKRKKMENQDDLKEFRYDEPRSMPMQDPLKVVHNNEEEVLAKIKFCSKDDKDHDHKDKCKEHHAVWLAATVGWRANAPLTSDGLIVLFRIRKGSKDGEVLFATRQGIGVDVQELRAETTSFIHVDPLFKNKFTTCHDDDDDETKYFLTAEVVADDPSDRALIIGPVVFTAAKIG